MRTWLLAAIASAVSYGLNNIFIKAASGKISDVAGALCIQTASFSMVLAYFLYMKWTGSEALVWSRNGILAAVASGILTGIGLIFLVATFRLGGPISIALPTLLIGQIFIAVVAGLIFFKEGFSLLKFLGLLFCILGIWLASTR